MPTRPRMASVSHTSRITDCSTGIRKTSPLRSWKHASACCGQVRIGLQLMAGDNAHICSSRNSDKETTADTDGLLVASGKTVVVSGFEEPTETVFAGRPEHEVSRYLP